MNNRSYDQRLEILQLEPLEVRRIVFDLILMFKMIKGLIEVDTSDFFTMNTNATRGHAYKINIQYSRINYRKFFFVNRTANIWNYLPEEIVESSSVLTFKQNLKSYDLRRYCRGRALLT